MSKVTDNNAEASTDKNKCSSCEKDYPRDSDYHPQCWKHRTCIHIDTYTWIPNDCVYCTYILQDHKTNPDKSGFSSLVQKLTRGRKSLKLSTDDIFISPQPVTCLGIDAFKQALVSDIPRESNAMDSLPGPSRKRPRYQPPVVEEEDDFDNDWESVASDDLYEDLDREDESINDEAPPIIDMDEEDALDEDWFAPIELNEERKLILKKALARTRGVYKSLYPDLDLISAKHLSNDNDPNFAFPLTNDSADLIVNASKSTCKSSPTLFDVNKLSYVSKKLPELQEFCVDNFIRSDAGRDLPFLSRTTYLSKFDRRNDKFIRKDLINSIFLRELAVLINSALTNGAGKPKLLEALSDLSILLLETSSINLFSRVKKMALCRRNLRKKVFGSHKSAVASKLVDTSIISEDLFCKVDAEKACQNMGLRTLSVRNSMSSSRGRPFRRRGYNSFRNSPRNSFRQNPEGEGDFKRHPKRPFPFRRGNRGNSNTNFGNSNSNFKRNHQGNKSQ